MSVTCAAGGWGCFLWEGDTSNKPFEWTGHHQLSAPPPQDFCLPLKGSVAINAATCTTFGQMWTAGSMAASTMSTQPPPLTDALPLGQFL